MRGLVIAALLGVSAPAIADDRTDRARALYTAAEAALAAGEFATAQQKYGDAYELTQDPALLYKLGVASERGSRCPEALIYYRRYLVEAAPSAEHVALTEARIAACTATLPPPRVEPPLVPRAPAPVDKPPVVAPPTPSSPAEPAQPGTAMGGFVNKDATADSLRGVPGTKRAAWLFVSGSIAFATIGAVLAYSADSAENDIDDLYVGFGGLPPTFTGEKKRLYEDLIAEGERFERYAWLSFGLAGATAITAAVLFWRDRGETLTVAPTATPTSAGVSAAFRF